MGPLRVKPAHQLSEEKLHHLAIGVALGQALVDIPIRVHGDYHADPRHHQLPRDRVAGSFRLPLPSSKIRHAKPPYVKTNVWLENAMPQGAYRYLRLVHVDDRLASGQDPDQFQSKLLAQHQILRCVPRT